MTELPTQQQMETLVDAAETLKALGYLNTGLEVHEALVRMRRQINPLTAPKAQTLSLESLREIYWTDLEPSATVAHDEIARRREKACSEFFAASVRERSAQARQALSRYSSWRFTAEGLVRIAWPEAQGDRKVIQSVRRILPEIDEVARIGRGQFQWKEGT